MRGNIAMRWTMLDGALTMRWTVAREAGPDVASFDGSRESVGSGGGSGARVTYPWSRGVVVAKSA